MSVDYSPKAWQTWNRSSALTPEVIAAINSAVVDVVPKTVEALMRTPEFEKLSYEGRTEAIDRLTNGIAAGLAEFIDGVKAELITLKF